MDGCCDAQGAAGALPYRAMWVSFLEYERMDMATEAAFAAQIDLLCAQCRALGVGRLIAQVRPMGDAFYRSRLFPFSHLITGVQGRDPGYDPLAVLLERAAAHGLSIEAWINPYRVRLSARKAPLADGYAPARWLAEDGESRRRVLRWDGGLYLNPASPDARALIVDGAEEILRAYPAVCGIHIDDYFYPATDPALDAESWRGEVREQDLPAWRREHVSRMVRALYARVKAVRADATLTISLQGSLDANRSGQYADAALWLGAPGYADAVIPQLYWGRHLRAPKDVPLRRFDASLAEWRRLPRDRSVRLMIGLGAYRVGHGDGQAADQAEWFGGHALSEMARLLRDAEDVHGLAIFRHDSLFDPAVDPALLAAEREALANVLGA